MIIGFVEAEALARDVVAKLRSAGHQAYLVGGCVRDLQLGIPPKDFDVSTGARLQSGWLRAVKHRSEQ